MAGPGHEYRIQPALCDLPVGVHPHQVQPGDRAEVTQQPRLDVLRNQRLPQQRVAREVDLTDREVVRRTPPGIDRRQFVAVQESGHVAQNIGSGCNCLTAAAVLVVCRRVPAHARQLRHASTFLSCTHPLLRGPDDGRGLRRT